MCPLQVGVVWKNEVEGWEHLNGLRISVAIGTREERLNALKTDADIYVINRENLQWLIDKSEIPFSYDMVVLVELPKGEVTTANAAVLCGKLTQMANGEIYVSDGVEEVIHDRKLDALVHL